MIVFGQLQKAKGQGDDNTTSCLLDCNYFKHYYRAIAIDLSKQQVLGTDPKTIQQINFTGNLARAVGATIFYIVEVAKETALDFSQRTVKVF